MSSELLDLKKRFSLLNPYNLPHWVHIEAFSLAEEQLKTWLYIDNNGDYQWCFDEGITVVESERITRQAFGLNSLFKSNNMKYSWTKVRNIFSNSPIKSQAWFALHLTHAFIHPQEIINTVKETQEKKRILLRQLKKVEKLSAELPTLLAVEWTNKLREVENKLGNHGPVFYPHPYGKITNLINALEQSKIKQGIQPKSVHGNNSARLFFMRSLTASFIKKTGKPYRRVVADAVSCAFDCNISESEVGRATRYINRETVNPMSQYIEENILNDLNISTLLKDPWD